MHEDLERSRTCTAVVLIIKHPLGDRAISVFGGQKSWTRIMLSILTCFFF